MNVSGINIVALFVIITVRASCYGITIFGTIVVRINGMDEKRQLQYMRVLANLVWINVSLQKLRASRELENQICVRCRHWSSVYAYLQKINFKN